MWQLENRCLMTDNMLEMPIHSAIVHDQFEPVPIFISKFEHYTLSESLIVIYELNILLAQERVHLGHPLFTLPQQKGRDPVVAKFIIYPASCQEVLDVTLQVLVQGLP
jgi:hypothetical protein